MYDQVIQNLMDQGAFSEIDIHFGRLVERLSEQESFELFLAAALLSHANSDGHVCLPLSWLAENSLVTDEMETGLTLPDLSEWLRILESSPVVGSPGDYKPMILDGSGRLYLYRYWEYEKIVAENLKMRAENEVQNLDLSRLKGGLSRLFGSGGNTIDWQRAAAFVATAKRFCVISGGPGTGKSSLIGKILVLLMEQYKGRAKVALAAPTGKAATRLQEAIRQGKNRPAACKGVGETIVTKTSTIHRLLGAVPGSPYFRHNTENPLPVDAVIIDEASMVDLALMAKLVQAVPLGARLILLGDRDQLSSVEAGAVLGDICDKGNMKRFTGPFRDRLQDITGIRVPVSREGTPGNPIQDCIVDLTHSYRFPADSGMYQVSTAVNNGDGDLALKLLKEGGFEDIQWKTLPSAEALNRALRNRVMTGYHSYLKSKLPEEALELFGRFRLLCALRKGPFGVGVLNLLTEGILTEQNLVSPQKRWYAGRPILITRNDYSLELFNGDIGLILPDPESGHEPRAFFLSPSGELRKLLPVRLPEHETIYAMTVHKSQGSEFEEALFLLPDKPSPILTRELIYTAITRARKAVEIWGREDVFVEAVRKRTIRASGLNEALWGKS